MPVSFNGIPENWKQPLFWLEVDPSQAGFPVHRQPALLTGIMIAAGTAAVDVPVAIGNVAAAKAAFGDGSMLERMVARFFAGNAAHELWCLPVAEPSAGAVATGSITIATQPTGAGTLSLYIAGQRVQVGVAADDTKAEVATAVAAAVTAATTLPVTAAVDGTDTSKVNLTCKWKGASGNDVDLRANYLGSYGGEELPAGLTLTLSGAKLTGGTSEPSFTAAIANLGDEPFEYVGLPFTDTTSVAAWWTEYGFSDSGRWGWMRQLYGSIWSARRETYANLMTWGPSGNEAGLSVLAIEPSAPTPIWEWTAAYTAKAARALLNDPARPLQTLALAGCLPAPKHQRFTIAERNAMAGVGIATQGIDGNGVPTIMRETTRYQKNSYGHGDDAYEVATTLATLARLFRDLRQVITSKFPRHKLADDGTRFGPGQAIVTPKIIKAEVIAQYRIEEFNGLVENAKAFKTHLIVERDTNNPNRVNMLWPPDIINQLRLFGTLAQFRLQYDRGVDLALA